MSTRDEADKLISRIYRLGLENGRCDSMTKLDEIGTEYVQASARLLALVAPPAPGEVTEDRRLLDWVRLNYPEVIDAYDEDREAAAPEQSR